MTQNSRRLGLVITIALMGAAASLLIERRGAVKTRERGELLRRQEDRAGALAAENGRLSNLVAQATAAPAAESQRLELARLRGEADRLRGETNRLAAKGGERLEVWQKLGYSPEYYYGERGKISEGKEKDAAILAVVLTRYLAQHRGEGPPSLDQLPPDLAPDHRLSLTGTNEFEIVYNGAEDELPNVPVGMVAVIRERQPWLAPDGQWARVYGMLGGIPETVESDDNFQSWEAEHIVVPKARTPR
jgi:hypothetical protein